MNFEPVSYRRDIRRQQSEFAQKSGKRAPATIRICAVAALLAVFSSAVGYAQHPWPVTPFDQTHEITGTFCEYRPTGSAPHFHNGADIPKADGSPVYPVIDGRITSLSRTGSNAFVRVDSYAYVHINPSPSLTVGDQVTAGTTVLGTIISGQGHVHFTDGFVGSERNALRSGGGLTPYTDPWPPSISNIRIYQAGTDKQFSTNEISGPVTITFRVREANAAPGASESRLNNGAYVVGYQILSSDRQQVVYSENTDGVQFRFDTKPSNSLVHRTFDPEQSSISSHVYYSTNSLTSQSGFDTSVLPPGEYVLQLFAEDTRGNRDEEFLDIQISRRDLQPPAQPTLFSAKLVNGRPQFSFSGGNEDDLAGYRLFSTTNNISWSLAADETIIDAGDSVYAMADEPARATYYYITAVDSVQPANVSIQSDVYGVSPGDASTRALLVDGFDRAGGSGSWSNTWHGFVYPYGLALRANMRSFETVSNERVVSGDVDLADYPVVIWILGDESTADETFSDSEQALVRTYLQGGGNLLVSGSEVAWDLEGSRNARPEDTDFLHSFLRVEFAGDDAGSLTAAGVSGSIFDGLNAFGYGTQPYKEDFPDWFRAREGAEVCLEYGNGRAAGVSFAGMFPGGTRPGKIIVLGFGLETIGASGSRNLLMRMALGFFDGVATAIGSVEDRIPTDYHLGHGYPNPFGSASSAAAKTTVRYSVPGPGRVAFTVYDLRGREVRRWAAVRRDRGEYALTWDGTTGKGAAAASGTYLLRMEVADPAGNVRRRTVRLLLLR